MKIVISCSDPANGQLISVALCISFFLLKLGTFEKYYRLKISKSRFAALKIWRQQYLVIFSTNMLCTRLFLDSCSYQWISNSEFAKQFNDYLVDCTASLNYQDYNESGSLPNVEEYGVHHHLEPIDTSKSTISGDNFEILHQLNWFSKKSPLFCLIIAKYWQLLQSWPGRLSCWKFHVGKMPVMKWV